MEMMGGRLSAESEVGRGSTFHFSARFSFGTSVERKTPSEEMTYPAGKLNPSEIGPSLRILLAEDSEINQEVAMQLLRRWGHVVTVAGNGKEAVAAWEQHKYDLVLMDVQMPEMDGLEATESIRASEKAKGGHIPVIAMTAHAMKGDLEVCLASGMDSYVSKPIEARKLLQAIRNLFFDESKALERIDGDHEGLRKAAGKYLERWPEELTGIHQTVASRDLVSLEKKAHKMKGMVGVFCAEAAMQAAKRLETIGRGGNAEGIDEVFQTMEQAIQLLAKFLRCWLDGSTVQKHDE